MKNILILILFMISTHVYTQPEIMSNKGKILVEANSTRGISFDNFGIDNIRVGLDIGYFIKEDLAIKTIYETAFFIGLEESRFVSGIHSLMLGGKYYIVGRIPIQMVGGLAIQGKNDFVEEVDTYIIGRMSAGYGIRLASNIFLEPNLAYNFNWLDNYLSFGMSFALFLGK